MLSDQQQQRGQQQLGGKQQQGGQQQQQGSSDETVSVDDDDDQQQYGGKIQKASDRPQKQQQGQGSRQQPGRQQQQAGKGSQAKPAFENTFDIVQYDADIPDSGETGGDVPILLADPFPNFTDADSVAPKKEGPKKATTPEQPNFLYDPPKRGWNKPRSLHCKKLPNYLSYYDAQSWNYLLFFVDNIVVSLRWRYMGIYNKMWCFSI